MIDHNVAYGSARCAASLFSMRSQIVVETFTVEAWILKVFMHTHNLGCIEEAQVNAVLLKG